MSQFRNQLRERVVAAQLAMAEAVASGDDYAVSVVEGQLESLERLARENQIDLSDPSLS